MKQVIRRREEGADKSQTQREKARERERETKDCELNVLTGTQKPVPEPTKKYQTLNQTENLQVSFGFKFLLPERFGAERNRPE